MMSRTTMDLWVGVFVAMGIAALFFLALKVGSISGSDIQSPYTLSARFDNIGGLKVRAPVKSGRCAGGAGLRDPLRQ
jgi:phospholipid/cholesterol/gamma-HCH transport system substrate-binding protein